MKSADVKWLELSVLLANVAKKIENLPPTDFRDELRILIHNMFEVLDRQSNED